MKKPYLPEKICPVCGRPFSWRKKWRLNWEEVIYCSERCRRTGKRKNQGGCRIPSSEEQ